MYPYAAPALLIALTVTSCSLTKMPSSSAYEVTSSPTRSMYSCMNNIQ